jgi:hypothetical protein
MLSLQLGRGVRYYSTSRRVTLTRLPPNSKATSKPVGTALLRTWSRSKATLRPAKRNSMLTLTQYRRENGMHPARQIFRASGFWREKSGAGCIAIKRNSDVRYKVSTWHLCGSRKITENRRARNSARMHASDWRADLLRGHAKSWIFPIREFELQSTLLIQCPAHSIL